MYVYILCVQKYTVDWVTRRVTQSCWWPRAVESATAPSQYVCTALAGTVWETVQEGLHAAALFGRTGLCGIAREMEGPKVLRTWVHAGCRASKTIGVYVTEN